MIKAVISGVTKVLYHQKQDVFANKLTKLCEPLPLSLIHLILVGNKRQSLLHAFETADITDEQYLQGLECLLDHHISRCAFWKNVHTGRDVIQINHEVEALFLGIRKKLPKTKLFGVFNTDPYRLKYIVESMELVFDGMITSHAAKTRNPRELISRAVINTGQLASQCLFVDADEENCSIALNLGMPHAHRFTNVNGLKKFLAIHSLI